MAEALTAQDLDNAAAPPLPNTQDLSPDRLEALLQTSLHLSQARDLPQLAEEALRRALDFANCESGSIMLLTEDGARLRIVAQIGLPADFADRFFPANAGVTGIAMRAHQPIFLRGSELSVEPRRRGSGHRDVPPSVCIPLITPQEHVLGTLNLNARPESIDLLEVDAAVLTAMARQLAVLIENTVLRQELENHVEELVALYQASHLIVTGHEEEDALEVMLRIVAQGLGASSASIFELADDGSLHCIALYREDGRATKLSRERPRSDPLLIQGTISEAATVPFGRWPGQGGGRGRAAYGWLGALQSENRVIALLEIQLGGPAVSAPVSSRRLAGLVNQVALALAHTRALETARTRERQLGVLLDRLITVEEEERLRLAHEIHDGLAQMLAGAHQALQRVYDSVDLPADGLGQDFDRGLQILRQSLAEVRRVIGGLRPLVLEDFGLATAIREHLQQLQTQMGWQAELLTRLRSARLPVAVEVGLYRIAQEALNNAAKHARTRKVRIRLEEHSTGILLEVRDFGRGFVMEEERNWHGGDRVGIAGMEERAKLLGGVCRITSATGSGTRVRVELPRKSYR
jgi:signal transduction histidine kinase